MDKIFSTRTDEAVVQTLDSLAAALRRPKKRIVEDAIRLYSQTMEQAPDPMELSFGAWRRNESAEELHRRQAPMQESGPNSVRCRGGNASILASEGSSNAP